MSYHALLDWRLGLGLLRVMFEKDYHSGADGNFNAPEIEDWLVNAQGLRDLFCNTFDEMEPITIQPVTGLGMPGIKVDGREIILIVHPFWNVLDNKEDGWLADVVVEAKVMAALTGGTAHYIDTFNLHRRQGRCYEWLLNGKCSL